MDVVLTSFGTGVESGLGECGDTDMKFSIFYRMPPLMLEDKGTLRLDYAALFMFDRVIVDQGTYQQAIAPELEKCAWNGFKRETVEMLQKSVAEYSEVLRALKSSGRLITKDFDAAFSEVRQIWKQATDHDMKRIPEWVTPLESSLKEWEKIGLQLTLGIEEFWSGSEVKPWEILFMPYRPHALTAYDRADHYLNTLRNWKKKQTRQERHYARTVVREYLSYINFNMILSFHLNAALLDWQDMQPFYDKKFALADRTKPPEARMATQSRKLFELMFPQFVPKTPRRLVRALEDKRVEELRLLIHRSLEGSEDFDSDFAIRTLKEVLRLEHRAIARRRICGWATLPLGIIPLVGTAVQKTVQEAINALWGNRELREYRWYYLINEIDES